MAKVLITGGAGFIGARLCEMLAQRGAEVTVFDNLSPQIHGAKGRDNSPTFLRAAAVADFIEGDVRDYDALTAAIPGHDAIIHLAAETGTAQSMYAQQHYIDVNISGTINLLRAIDGTVGGTVRRILVASTRAIYGEGQYDDRNTVICADPRDHARLIKGDFGVYSPSTGSLIEPRPTAEDCQAKPNSTYAITKLAQEQLILNYGRTSGIETVALRLQNVYGPGQSLKNPYTGLLSVFSTRILNRKSIMIFEDGLCTRDFVFVDDVANAMALATLSDIKGLGIINIGSGQATTILDAAEMLMASLGQRTELQITGAFRAGDIRHNFARIARAQKLLGYLPQTNVVDGIALFSSWVKTQPISDDLFDRSIAELKARNLFVNSQIN